MKEREREERKTETKAERQGDRENHEEYGGEEEHLQHGQGHCSLEKRGERIETVAAKMEGKNETRQAHAHPPTEGLSPSVFVIVCF